MSNNHKMINKIGGSQSRAVLDGKISKKYVVYAPADSLYDTVYYLFKGTTNDVL